MAGSAVATLLAQILSNGYLWYAMKKLNPFHVFSRTKRIIASGALMAAVTILLSAAHINVLLNIAVSGIVYCSTLFILREPLLREMKKIIVPNVIEA
jgi:O-antigen/teichoic acid export membrane protein